MLCFYDVTNMPAVYSLAGVSLETKGLAYWSHHVDKPSGWIK